ncbi:LysR family transcriptional regulator [Aliagarivorans marinus]|uniref:LysR family transcriptional regulator n=1 Tax=Aliagarivorans marinus TaxID=561965 RepID=UPI0003F8BC9F|nr:LysR family transcriptional regulator [Aliagarivorans marinus]
MNSQLFDGMVIFTELVKQGSFTKAAQKLEHSTSYISKELTKLEERLGVRLLQRSTRSLNLTAEGQLYYAQAEQLVDDAAALERAMQGQQASPSGVLRISCPTSLGINTLPRFLEHFNQRYPRVSFDIELNDKKVDLIADGFDLAIRATTALDDSSLISRKFATFRAVMVASPAYLARFGTPQTPDDLRNHKLICYSNLPNYNQWRFTGPDGQQTELALHSFVATNSSQLEVELCIAGQGIMRMPEFNLGDELSNGRLVEVLKDYSNGDVDVYLVYPNRKHMSSKVRSFIDMFLEHKECIGAGLVNSSS